MTETVNPALSEKEMGLFPRIINVFISPTSTFEAVRQKPNWLIALILSLFITAIAMHFLTPVIMQQQREATINKMEEKGISDEQIDKTIEIQQKMSKYTIVPGTVIFGFLGTLLLAAVWLFVANIILGGKAKFAQMLGVVVFGGYIGLLGLIIKFYMMWSQKTMDVHFSLAMFLSENSKETFLYKFLKNIELFNIWGLAVTAIGIAVVARVGVKKSGPWVAIISLLYFVVTAALGGAFAR